MREFVIRPCNDRNRHCEKIRRIFVAIYFELMGIVDCFGESTIRLAMTRLRGTLLFAKAKSSKNFCADSHFVRTLFCLDTSLRSV